MVFCSDVAVVLRARRGRNLLLQAHGLNVRLVTQAALEVSSILEGGASTVNVEYVDSGVGQASPALSCGHLRVLGSMYNAVYRLVGQVLVMIITRAHDNVFASLNMVLSITRLLVAECKTIEVSPDRIERRYAQVYLAIDALVSRGTLDTIQALIDSNAVLEGLTPEGAAKAKKAKLLSEKAQQQGQQKPPQKQIDRRLPDPAKQRARFSFVAPSELTNIHVPLPNYPLPPVPPPDRPLMSDTGGAAGAKPRITFVDDDLFGSQAGMQQQEGDDPFGDNAFSQQASARQSAAGADGQQGEWSAFGADQAQQQSQGGMAPLPLHLPSGPSLRLVEVHRSEVWGERIGRAGLLGVVRWSSQEARTLSGSAPFRLTPPDFPDSMLRSALKCARAADRGTKPGAEFGILMADAISPLPASAPLLSYSLPATAGVQAPLLVRLGAAALALRGGGVGVLLTLQCAVSAEVGRTFRDLAIEFVVPPAFGKPRKVSPAGAQWGASQCRLRWVLKGLYPGFKNSMAVAFKVKGGHEAALAGLAAVHALCRLRGEAGTTLTGVGLMQAPNAMVPLVPTPAMTEWQAWVVARPTPMAPSS